MHISAYATFALSFVSLTRDCGHQPLGQSLTLSHACALITAARPYVAARRASRPVTGVGQKQSLEALPLATVSGWEPSSNVGSASTAIADTGRWTDSQSNDCCTPVTGPSGWVLPPPTKGSGAPGLNGSSNGRSTGAADPKQTAKLLTEKLRKVCINPAPMCSAEADALRKFQS